MCCVFKVTASRPAPFKGTSLSFIWFSWGGGGDSNLTALIPRSQVGEVVSGNGSLEWLDLDGDVTASRLGLCPLLWKER